MASIHQLIARLGGQPIDQALLKTALTHSSFVNDHPERADTSSNERLEFFGDAVVDFVAAQLVYERFPQRGEGDLSELRAALVKTSALADYARALGLGAYIRLGRGEESSGGRARDALLADTFEALVAAIYLGAGPEQARAMLLPFFEGRLATLDIDTLRLNYRTLLQERIQGQRGITPRYRTLSESGPDHQREYVVAVLIGDEQVGVGSGHSKQIAAQAAARAALEALG